MKTFYEWLLIYDSHNEILKILGKRKERIHGCSNSPININNSADNNNGNIRDNDRST